MLDAVKDLRFLFLGTGTSGGIPVIACDCAACTSDDPRDRRTRQGAAVLWTDADGHERCVLIDTTPDLREQALRHDLRRCDAILFTHSHVDHVFGLDEVRRFNAVMKAPIDIYADEHTMQALRRVYRHIFDKNSNINDSFVATLIPRPLEPELPIDLHGLRFTPIRLLHGKMPILGFRIEAAPGSPAPGNPTSRANDAPPLPLAYCTAPSGIPTETWAYLEGLDTLVLDGLRQRHHPTHFTIGRAVDHALQIGARRTWLVHIAHEVLHSEVDPTLPEGIALAYDALMLSADHEGPAPEPVRQTKSAPIEPPGH